MPLDAGWRVKRTRISTITVSNVTSFRISGRKDRCTMCLFFSLALIYANIVSYGISYYNLSRKEIPNRYQYCAKCWSWWRLRNMEEITDRYQYCAKCCSWWRLRSKEKIRDCYQYRVKWCLWWRLRSEKEITYCYQYWVKWCLSKKGKW